jgi:hypothetical protein
MQAAAFNLARSDERSRKGGRERNAQSAVADGVAGDFLLPVLERPAFAGRAFRGGAASSQRSQRVPLRVGKSMTVGPFMASRRSHRVDFRAISNASLPSLPALAKRWLPDGKRRGFEWVARNPTRADRKPGSFKINLRSGRWADFAPGTKGGDVISLAAHLFGLSQVEAARKIAAMVAIPAEGEQ